MEKYPLFLRMYDGFDSSVGFLCDFISVVAKLISTPTGGLDIVALPLKGRRFPLCPLLLVASKTKPVLPASPNSGLFLTESLISERIFVDNISAFSLLGLGKFPFFNIFSKVHLLA